MNEKTRIVFNGILDLSPQEQQDLIQAWDDYANRSVVQKQTVVQENRSAAQVAMETYLGPMGNPCPCCGRS